MEAANIVRKSLTYPIIELFNMAIGNIIMCINRTYNITETQGYKGNIIINSIH